MFFGGQTQSDMTSPTSRMIVVLKSSTEIDTDDDNEEPSSSSSISFCSKSYEFVLIQPPLVAATHFIHYTCYTSICGPTNMNHANTSYLELDC